MEKKEPRATRKECEKHVCHYQDVPFLELTPGIRTQIVPAEQMTVIFANMAPNARVPLHKHEAEQIMIIIDGACDEIINGKLYHLEKGDVCDLPSNIEHGTYVSEQGLRDIEVFYPARQEQVAKLEELKRRLAANRRSSKRS